MTLNDIIERLKQVEGRQPDTVSDEELREMATGLRSVRQKLEQAEHRLSVLLGARNGKTPLHRSWGEYRLTQLMKCLRNQGMRARKTDVLKEALERQAYRLMELVRSGRREEAFYLLLRAYLVNGHPFPRDLQEAFLPLYSAEETKLLVFSYIGGLTSKEKS